MQKRQRSEESERRDEEGREEGGVRVRDRRRVHFDEAEGVRVDEAAAEEPALKPKYVEELEARTRAAEQKAQDVQARFDQVRAELQRESVGQQFNPELHEGVDTTEVEPERDGTVTAEYSRGYRVGSQLLRPARVQVGRAAGSAQAAAE